MPHRSRSAPFVLIAGLLLAWSPAAADDGCELPAGVEDLVSKLGAKTRACGQEAACLEAARAEWRELLDKHPNSVPLHRQYQNQWTGIDRERAMSEYKARLDAHPDDPAAMTLYARTLPVERKEERNTLLARALERDPQYAWAHFSLAWMYTGRTGEEDKDFEKAKPHILAFAEACPTSDFATSLARQVGDRPLEAKVDAIGRGAIDKLRPEQAVRRYASAWSSAFRTAPVAEHAAVRERVKAEVAQVRAMKLEDSRPWWRALQEGYKLIGDKAAQTEVEQEIARRYPCEFDGVRYAIEAWEKAHPAPGPGGKASPDRARARFDFTRGLVERCPKAVYGWGTHFRAAADLSDLPRKELQRIIDTYLDLYARPDAGFRTFPSPYETVAELYMERGFRLDDVKPLLEKDRTHRNPAPLRAGATERDKTEDALRRRQAEWQYRLLTTRADHRLGEKKNRDAGLRVLQTKMDEETDPKAKARMAAQYAWLRGDVAASEKRWADAFGLYNEASAGMPGERKVALRRDDAWKRLGGSAEVLASVVATSARSGVATAASSWTPVERKLPATTLDRLGGGQWATADFQGKRTLVNFWATWCGPCVRELPYIQRLHERIKDRTDIAVLTLNVDDSVGLVEPFVAENKYTFPVVYAESFWDKLDVRKAIPTNWLVDEAGVARLEHTGFNEAKADAWIEDVLARLDSKDKATATN